MTTHFFGAAFCLCCSMFGLRLAGIRIWLPDGGFLMYAEVIALAAIFYWIFGLICRAVCSAQSLALVLLHRLAAFLSALARRLAAAATRTVSSYSLRLAALAYAPVRALGGRLYAAYVAPYADAYHRRRELRRLYREVRDQYASFADFLRAFEQGADFGQDPGSGDRHRPDHEAPAVNPFDSACKVLGLCAERGFTQAEFKARYRELMKAVHPDKIGVGTFATQLNEARDLIKARKGWK
jgi:hypothetical protein